MVAVVVVVVVVVKAKQLRCGGSGGGGKKTVEMWWWWWWWWWSWGRKTIEFYGLKTSINGEDSTSFSVYMLLLRSSHELVLFCLQKIL